MIRLHVLMDFDEASLQRQFVPLETFGWQIKRKYYLSSVTTKVYCWLLVNIREPEASK